VLVAQTISIAVTHDGCNALGLATGLSKVIVGIVLRDSWRCDVAPLCMGAGGMPVTEALRFNQGYITAFDYRTRCPK
jgi:hypothetical protein